MDGAGRSRRSRGSPEPKTDLKAAAIGAVVLLREYFGFDRKRVKASRHREQPNRAILWLERYSPRRAVLTLTVTTLLGSAVLGVIKMRITHPRLPRPYRTWGYPVIPALFLIASLFLLGNYMISEPMIFAADVLVILAGLPVYWWWEKRASNLK